MIRIKEIELENFKIYKKEKVEFEDNQLILLTGPNGYGKTSLVDAIEWCITGDIKRAHDNYVLRYTSAPEKKRLDNKSGILKNKNAKKSELVKVRLTLVCNGQEIAIVRKRKDDTLECNEEFEIESEHIPESIRKEIEDLRSQKKSLYKYNFCDMNKAYRFMNFSRKDMKEQLSDFLQDRTDVNILLDRLKEKQNIIDEEMENNIEKITRNIEKKKNKLSEKSKIIVSHDINSYSEFKAYEEEPLQINTLEQAQEVRNFIRGWGYYYVLPQIKKLDNSQKAIGKKIILINIKDEYKKQELLIEKFIKLGLYKEEKRNEIYNKIKGLAKQKDILKKKFAAEEQEYKLYEYIHKRFIEDQNKYNSFLDECDLLQKNIDSLDKTGRLVEIFTSLYDAKKEIIKEYRDKGNKECPLCGSAETFSKIEESDLAVGAKKHLEKQSKLLKETISMKDKKKKDAEKVWDNFNEFFSNWFDKEKVKLEEEKKKQIEEWSKVEKFFELINENKITVYKNFYEEISNKINEVSKDIVSNEEKIKINNDAFKVLGYLNYSNLVEIQSEDYSNSISIISTLCNNDMSYNEFDYKVMLNKLTYLTSYISSNEMNEIDQEIKILQDNLSSLEKGNKKLENQKDKLKEFIDKLGKKLKELDQVEFEEVGPYLYKIFSKIIKHTNITEFQFKRDNSSKVEAGSGFLDADNKNILNMFSEGQLGVFMISYFIGNLLRRRDEGVLDTFFMDDITNCLDDINVLSFIDIIKYLIKDTSNSMNQLFFATCNENIMALFKNRMEGFNISYKIIEFKAVGKVDQVK